MVGAVVGAVVATWDGHGTAAGRTGQGSSPLTHVHASESMPRNLSVPCMVRGKRQAHLHVHLCAHSIHMHTHAANFSANRRSTIKQACRSGTFMHAGLRLCHGWRPRRTPLSLKTQKHAHTHSAAGACCMHAHTCACADSSSHLWVWQRPWGWVQAWMSERKAPAQW